MDAISMSQHTLSDRDHQLATENYSTMFIAKYTKIVHN